MLKPKSFAGLFGAAPSVAVATLGLTVLADGKAYAALKPDPWSSELHPFFAYSALCTWLMLRKKINAAPATIGSLIVWLAAALGTRR